MTLNNVSHNLENLRFSGLLDSAKTAHPVPSATEINNWWMPSDEDTHLLHCAAAEVTAIKQVLWGEMLQLPRNQSFDSPAWLNLADFFVKSELPLFSICVIGKNATPDAFVKDCAQQFEPTSPFALSAWPDLTNEQRKIISEDIDNQGNFKKMFARVKPDSRWKPIFEFQQEILQRMLEYLEKHYKLEPQIIRAVDYAPTTTWYRIERDYKDPQFISKMRTQHGDELTSDFQAVLEEIKAKAIRDIGDNLKKRESWLSGRTNLYKEIYSVPRELREILRAEIDRCYVETTSESVTGIGRFSDADRADTELLIDNRFYNSLLADADNDPAGLSEYYIIDFEHLRNQEKSIEDFLRALKDKGITKRIRELREIRNEPGMPINYVDKKKKEHLEALCQELPNIVIQREQKLFRIAWRTGKFVANVWIGRIISEATSFVKDIYSEIASEATNELTDGALDAAKVQTKVSELIAKKRQEDLAGILRDWLTKEIKIGGRKQ
jgi:hypothetical protein